jgi:threonine/homoserine/homoserine lactone efflux protein
MRSRRAASVSAPRLNCGVRRHKEPVVSIELWVAFVLAAAIVLAIPGPTILTVISYSVAHGRRANVPLVLAVALGDSTAVLASLFGLGALLSVSALWFTVVKWAGGAYLIYLGVKLVRAGVASASMATPSLPTSRWRVFANTYLVTALNPKSIVFFVAFLPQFIDRSGNLVEQSWVLAATFVSMAAINAALYAVFAGSARKLLASRRVQQHFNLAGGSLLIAAGVWGLLARRAA